MRKIDLYGPVSSKTGFCGGGSPFGGALAALKGATRSFTSVSAEFPPVAIVFVLVVTTATAPPSHMLAYTRVLSGEAAADIRKRADAGL